jgi:hypothetical protein
LRHRKQGNPAKRISREGILLKGPKFSIGMLSSFICLLCGFFWYCRSKGVFSLAFCVALRTNAFYGSRGGSRWPPFFCDPVEFAEGRKEEIKGPAGFSGFDLIDGAPALAHGPETNLTGSL